MARKRMIDPELLRSKDVTSLPIPSRFAWIALVLYVDDEGRGVDSVDLVKAHSWPRDHGYTAKKVAADLVRFYERGMICRYTIDDEDYLHIPSWSTWQKISHPSPSRIAPCPGELYKGGHADFLRKSSRGTPEGLSAVEVSLDEKKLSGSSADAPEGATDLAAVKAEVRARLRAVNQ